MPELPFTFDDLVNLDAAEPQRASREAKPDMSMSNPMNRAQSFLKGKMGQLKEHMSSVIVAVIDIGGAPSKVFICY